MTPPRRALVTGATSGIGHAIALALADRGYVLALQGRDADRLGAVVTEVQARGAEASGHRCDLTDDVAVDDLVAELAVNPLHVLVHSAGMVTLGTLAETPVEVLDAHYRLNVRAPYRLTAGLLVALRDARGHIVFLNSGAGRRANPGWGAYAASKFALRAIADSLRDELAADGVRVTSVFPGRTATPMQRSVHEQEQRSYDAAAYVRPEDVAAQVAALLEVEPPGVVTELDIRPT